MLKYPWMYWVKWNIFLKLISLFLKLLNVTTKILKITYMTCVCGSYFFFLLLDSTGLSLLTGFLSRVLRENQSLMSKASMIYNELTYLLSVENGASYNLPFGELRK